MIIAHIIGDPGGEEIVIGDVPVEVTGDFHITIMMDMQGYPTSVGMTLYDMERRTYPIMSGLLEEERETRPRDGKNPSAITDLGGLKPCSREAFIAYPLWYSKPLSDLIEGIRKEGLVRYEDGVTARGSLVTPLLPYGSLIPEELSDRELICCLMLTQHPMFLRVLIQGDYKKPMKIYGAGLHGLRESILSYLGVELSQSIPPIPMRWTLTNPRFVNKASIFEVLEETLVFESINRAWDMAYVNSHWAVQGAVLSKSGYNREEAPIKEVGTVLNLLIATQIEVNRKDPAIAVTRLQKVPGLRDITVLEEVYRSHSLVSGRGLYKEYLMALPGIWRSLGLFFFRESRGITFPGSGTYPKKTQERREWFRLYNQYRKVDSLPNFLSMGVKLMEGVVRGVLATKAYDTGVVSSWGTSLLWQVFQRPGLGLKEMVNSLYNHPIKPLKIEGLGEEKTHNAYCVYVVRAMDKELLERLNGLRTLPIMVESQIHIVEYVEGVIETIIRARGEKLKEALCEERDFTYEVLDREYKEFLRKVEFIHPDRKGTRDLLNKFNLEGLGLAKVLSLLHARPEWFLDYREYIMVIQEVLEREPETLSLKLHNSLSLHLRECLLVIQEGVARLGHMEEGSKEGQ